MANLWSFRHLRFLVDFTRADPHVLFGLTLVQVLYAPTIAFFAYQLWSSFRQRRREKTLPEERTEEAA